MTNFEGLYAACRHAQPLAHLSAGGTRVNAFVSGGYVAKVAPAQVGKKLEGLTHVCDFYATFAHLAGVDNIVDHRAAEAGLPPVG